MRGFADSSTGVCICRITFLTGASNNHNDSFPFFLERGGGDTVDGISLAWKSRDIAGTHGNEEGTT